MRTIQDNKLELFIEGDRENTLLDSVMYYNDEDKENRCELANEGGCITDYQIYFGTSDSHDPIFCPHHYFTGGGYEIVVKKEEEPKKYECNVCKDTGVLSSDETDNEGNIQNGVGTVPCYHNFSKCCDSAIINGRCWNCKKNV